MLSLQVFSNTRCEVWDSQNNDWDSEGSCINIVNVDLGMYVSISLCVSDIQSYAVWRKHSVKVIVERCAAWFLEIIVPSNTCKINDMLSWCSQQLCLKVSLLLFNSFYWHRLCEIVRSSIIDFLLHSNLIICHCHFLEQMSELSCLSRETELRTMVHVFHNVNIVKQ